MFFWDTVYFTQAVKPPYIISYNCIGLWGLVAVKFSLKCF